MAKLLTRAGRAAVLDRKVFTETFFDDDAMADSALLVAAVGALTYLGLLWLGVLGSFSISGLLQVLIGAVVSWLILGFATWLGATRLFRSGSRPQPLLAMQGLAVPPLLLEVFGGWVAAAGLLWYLAILVVATKEGSDLPLKLAAVSVLIGFAAAAVIRALMGVPFLVLGGLLG